jgi:hypothetical protein
MQRRCSPAVLIAIWRKPLRRYLVQMSIAKLHPNLLRDFEWLWRFRRKSLAFHGLHIFPIGARPRFYG